jgi:hypothetical protein
VQNIDRIATSEIKSTIKISHGRQILELLRNTQNPARNLNIVAKHQSKNNVAAKEEFEIFREKEEVEGRSIKQ